MNSTSTFYILIWNASAQKHTKIYSSVMQTKTITSTFGHLKQPNWTVAKRISEPISRFYNI